MAGLRICVENWNVTHLKPMPTSRMPCQLGANVSHVKVRPSVAFVNANDAPAAFTAAQSTLP